MQSAVEFATNTRIHVALAASDVERSIAFYTTLLGEPPTKVRPGYAKFEPAEPPVNLTLNQSDHTAGDKPGAAHFGVQVKTTEAVAEATKRFGLAGIKTETEEQVACCYAVQDKVWASDPDGNRWEVFVVLDNEALADNSNCSVEPAKLVELG